MGYQIDPLVKPDSKHCLLKTNKSKRKEVRFGGKVMTDKKSALFCFSSIFNPTHHSLPFCLDFLTIRMGLVRKRCGGKLGLSVLSIPCQKLYVRYYNTLTITCCACKQRLKNHKKNIQTIMGSTRSSDYAAIGGSSNGRGSGS
jgi:hypothetical protein